MSARATSLVFAVAAISLSACGVATGGGGIGVYVADGTTADSKLAADATPVTDSAADSPVVPSDSAADFVGDGGTDANTADVADGDAIVTDIQQVDTPPADAGPDAAVDAGMDTGPDSGPDVNGTSIGSPCTKNSECIASLCDSNTHVCVACVNDLQCASGSLCFGGQCVAQTVCKSDVACKSLKQVCFVSAGVCVDCNSANDCGANEACVGHVCKASITCVSSKDCPSVCNKSTGKCVECLDNNDCSDAQFCGADHACHTDVCVLGACSGNKYFPCLSGGSGFGAPTVCGSTPCETGACNVSGCVTIGISGSCDDGNPCTVGDTCSGGGCSGKPKVCEDNDACTANQCDKFGNCVFPSTGGNCDDGNSCTQDFCNAQTGKCQHNTFIGSCDDGDPCTENDVCSGGFCKPGGAATCDDKDPCTTDSCEVGNGCVHTAISGCTSSGCGADPTNTCQGKCTTSTSCEPAFCGMIPQFCTPDWKECCGP